MKAIIIYQDVTDNEINGAIINRAVTFPKYRILYYIPLEVDGAGGIIRMNDSIITIQELQQAIAAGAPVTVIINGEYYTITEDKGCF